MNRLGLLFEEFSAVTARTRAKILHSYEQHLNEILAEDSLYNDIVSMDPSPYPTLKPVDPDLEKKSSIYGRRFEINLLLLKMKQCNVCGKTKPVYCPPRLGRKMLGFDKSQSHRRKTFAKRFYGTCAWLKTGHILPTMF